MSNQELKSILTSIRKHTVMTEGELYNMFCSSETSQERSRVLSALYTLEDRGYIKCFRQGELKSFMVNIPDRKVQ